jgi:EAL domain-containing protein (putative c-di-GMP-specific phosphodiesterase class I)
VFLSVDEGPQEALAVAARVNAVLSTPCRLSDLEIRIGCAIGCAVHESGCDGDELIRRSQFALKRAKTTGETEIYQPRAHDLARHQFTIETSLRRAIEAERLTLAFQPVIDLATGSVAGFEALARWREDERDISPATFIPVAEESGLIVPLGRWAMSAALKTLADWDRRSGGRAGSGVAVNVSAIQIARDDLPRLVSDALFTTGIEPERLTLELTESAIVAEPERANRILDQLREIGATLALDDFGTGYSNLAYLQRLPIDVMKIDQSFVTAMLGDRDKVAIVRAILSLADALGLKTTAEGVESVQLAQTLAALGCTRGQGYYFAPPLDAEAAFEFWSRSSSAAI